MVTTTQLQSELDSLTNTVAGKADKAPVTTLQNQMLTKASITSVNAKANQTDLTALATTVSGKASQASVNSLATVVAGKADHPELDALRNLTDTTFLSELDQRYLSQGNYASLQAQADAAVAAAQGSIPSSEKGAGNGVATLDGGGTLTSTQIPASLNDAIAAALASANSAQSAAYAAQASAAIAVSDVANEATQRGNGDAALQAQITALGAGSALPFTTAAIHGAKTTAGFDNRDAIQAAIDAVHANGGGTVFVHERYGWKGDITHRGGVTVVGVGVPLYSADSDPTISDTEPGLIALDATSRYIYGSATSGSVDDNPGPLMNIMIDGMGVGGSTPGQLVLFQGAQGRWDTVHVINSAGDGVTLNGMAQNSNLNACYFGYATNSAVRFTSYAAGYQGPGGNKFTNCYFAESNKQLYADAVDAAGWSHDNFFIGCLFENYGGSAHSLIHFKIGEAQFVNCVFTDSHASSTYTKDALVYVEDTIWSGVPTYLSFENCYFNTGGGVHYGIRSTMSGVGNDIRVHGRTKITNLTYLICADGGGVYASVDGSYFQSGVTSIFGAINGGVIVSGGVTGREAVSPVNYKIPDSMSLVPPMTFGRSTESHDRGRIDRDMTLYWLTGANESVVGSLAGNADGVSCGGLWKFSNGVVWGMIGFSVNASAVAVALSGVATAAPAYVLSFSGATPSANVTVSGGDLGSKMEILLDSTATAGATVSWPAAFKFRGNAPQPVDGGVVCVNLIRLADTNWYEESRSSGVSAPNTRTTSYTLAITDAGRTVEESSASATTITVPANSSVSFPVGTRIEVCQIGTGQITISGASGVTILTPSSYTTRTQNSTVTLRKRDTDTWVLSGDLT